MKITFEFTEFTQAQRFVEHAAYFFAGGKILGGEPPVVPGNPVAESDAKTPAAREEDPPVEEKTSTRRRGRPAKKEEEAEKPAGRRARRSSLPVEDSADSDAEDIPMKEISDADATKAASEAAKTLSVQVVLEELEVFGVKKVSDLTQPQRAAFLERLRDLLNPSEDAVDPAFT